MLTKSSPCLDKTQINCRACSVPHRIGLSTYLVHRALYYLLVSGLLCTHDQGGILIILGLSKRLININECRNAEQIRLCGAQQSHRLNEAKKVEDEQEGVDYILFLYRMNALQQIHQTPVEDTQMTTMLMLMMKKRIEWDELCAVI